MDTFLKIHEARVALQIDTVQAQLCIDYAEKIPVDEYHRFAAGCCVNVATSTARLGLATAVYGVTGADPEGNAIRAALEAEGIDIGLMATDTRCATNASVAVVFRGERTIFVWHQRRDYELPMLPASAWVYMASAGPAGPHVDRLHADVCREVTRTGARLAFNPGTHQLRMGAHGLAGLLERAELLVLNRQEAAELTGPKEASVPDLLARLRRLGPRTVVITDGPGGSFASSGDGLLQTGILDTPVVDRTGAGDAFGSGLLAGLAAGRPLAEAMAWGTVQAAHVVTVFGATPGLVGRAQLEAELAAHPELVARELRR
jgi:ribokinase